MPHNDYRRDLMGHAVVSPSGRFEAGSWASFTLTYTAGKFGIDDRGCIMIAFRPHSDQTPIQLDDPAAPGFTTVETTTGIPLTVSYETFRNIRPWKKILLIRCQRYLAPGEKIIVHYGDTRQGSPGLRLQTFCEETFEFHILADPFSTFDFIPLLDEAQATIAIVPGPPAAWKAVLPTLRRPGEPFRFSLKAEDRWGNPSDRIDAAVHLESSIPVSGLPETVTFRPGQFTTVIENLTADISGEVRITVRDDSGALLTQSNPLIIADGAYSHYWSDMHGQSEETVGTNSACDYFKFGRDKAFLDICAHQANDLQTSDALWAEVNKLTAVFNEDGRYLTLPGYEWSGNTRLGGDHNVWYRNEGRPIYRSSRALVADRTAPETDCHDARELFERLRHEDAIVTAHVGGRYADVKYAHDASVEPSVEIHSAWGTFEWVVQDAFDAGYRIGIVASSDGHKGRPGASYPGDGLFGSYGGLTCHLLPALNRDEFFEGFRRRHHYATTGARLFLDVAAEFGTPATLFHRNPALDDVQSEQVSRAIMGDIVQVTDDTVTMTVSAAGSAPLERIDLMDGFEIIETVRFHDGGGPLTRIRLLCQGGEYRGRSRNVTWHGEASVDGSRIERITAVNFWNPNQQPELISDNTVRWNCVTTGGFSGFDLWLGGNAGTGTLHVRTNQIDFDLPLSEITVNDNLFDCGGLGKAIRIFRLPSQLVHFDADISRSVAVKPEGDSRLMVRLTQEDGHQAWSSPIYVFKK